MQQKEELVTGLTPPSRRLYRAIEAHGPLGAPDLRVDLPLPDGDIWKGRPDGLTKELRGLQSRGLIRQCDERHNGGPPTRIYEVTPEGEIDKAVQKYKRQRPARKRDMTGHAAQIADFKQQEKEAGTSSRAHFLEDKRKIVELSARLRRIEPRLFWSKKSIHDDELELIWETLMVHLGWVQKIVASADGQRGNREWREKIEQMRKAEGRTEMEAETFRRKADELERKLEAGEL